MVDVSTTVGQEGSGHPASIRIRSGSELGLIRIRSSPGVLSAGSPPRHVGMGFLLTDKIAVTCAHVINEALPDRETLEDSRQPEHGEVILLSFPILSDEGQLQARVVGWSQPLHPGIDCAILELKEPAPNEVGVAILSVVPATELERAPVSVFGTLEPTHPGAHLSGHLLGPVNARWAQIDIDGRFGIQPGYSGGGVWSTDQRAVIGMNVARQTDKDGIVAYFLPAERIAEKFGGIIPVEIRRLPLRRQTSFTFVATLLFVLVLLHHLANRAPAAATLVPWTGSDALHAAFLGSHVFAIILGPYVMWHAMMHARSFARRPWWQRVPSVYGFRSAAMLDNTPIGALMVTLFLLVLPAVGQGHFLFQSLLGKQSVEAYLGKFEGTKGWCLPQNENWCGADGVGIWSFRRDLPYGGDDYRLVGGCSDEDCKTVTFFPFWQPALLFLSTAIAYSFLAGFIYALFRPWLYRSVDPPDVMGLFHQMLEKRKTPKH